MANRLALTAAVLSAGLVVATPAAAEQSRYQDYRYSQNYNGYGRHGDVRALHYQIAEIRRDIHDFDRRGMLTRKEARKLDKQARHLQDRIQRMSYYGMNRGEWNSAQHGIANLQRMIRHDLRDRGNGRDDRRWRDRRHGDHDRYDRRHNRRDRWDD